MKTTIRFSKRLGLSVAVILLAANCSHQPYDAETTQSTAKPKATRGKLARRPAVNGDPAFPRPAELEPAIDFWRKTYAVWHRYQVAIHDDRYLDVVYEVLELPAPVGDSLTPEQKAFVGSRRDYWKDRLLQLDGKIAAGQMPNAEDRALMDTLGVPGPFRTVLAGASERVRSQRGMLERFKRGLDISVRYEQQFRQIFREAGLPEDLALLPHVESSFQSSAQSSAGAVGIWQFTRGAAEKFMNVSAEHDERLDPVASTYGATRYLSYAFSKLGDWPSALTSYNHGINGMMRAQNQVGSDFVRIVKEYDSPKFGFASRNYYAEFLAARDIVYNPGIYFAEMAGDAAPER